MVLGLSSSMKFCFQVLRTFFSDANANVSAAEYQRGFTPSMSLAIVRMLLSR